MAYTDYDQGQIVAQIQSFFQLKQEADSGFLKGTKLSSIDGSLGGANSNTNKSMQAWLEEKGLNGDISPSDPNYLEKVYNAVRVDMESDPAVINRLQEMSGDPASLSEEQRMMLRAGNALQGHGGMVLINDPAAEQEATQATAKTLQSGAKTFSVKGMEDEDPLSDMQKEAATHAMGFLKQNGLASQALQDQVGEEIDSAGDYRAIQGAIKNNEQALKNKAGEMASNPAGADVMNIFMMQAALGMFDQKYATTVDGSLGSIARSGAENTWGSHTLSVLQNFMSAESTQTPTAEQNESQIPSTTSENYASYFINNVVLNRNDYGIHARKVWEDMQENKDLGAGEAIESYLKEYGELYSAANDGAEIPDIDVAAIRGQLVPQIKQLQGIEASIEGVRPTPELIADNFIETHALPNMSEPTKIAWRTMQEDGLSAEEAINQYKKDIGEEGHSGPKEGDSYLQGVTNEVLQKLTNEIQLLDNAHKAIIDYENMGVTPQATIDTIRAGWVRNGIEPERMENYGAMLEQKIGHYQSDEGGNLDAATASARAAVDIRAQIDRDNGVPERAIVDENHTYYQSDILKMGNWLHDKAYVQQQTEAAAARGESVQQEDIMRPMTGFGYSVYRRSNLEQAMGKAYEEAAKNPAPETKTEQNSWQKDFDKAATTEHADINKVEGADPKWEKPSAPEEESEVTATASEPPHETMEKKTLEQTKIETVRTDNSIQLQSEPKGAWNEFTDELVATIERKYNDFMSGGKSAEPEQKDPQKIDLTPEFKKMSAESSKTPVETSEPKPEQENLSSVATQSKVKLASYNPASINGEVWEKFLNHLTDREGYRNDVYPEKTSNQLHVGVGHLVTPKDNLQLGDVISDERVQELLKQDVEKAHNAAIKQASELGVSNNSDFTMALTSVNFQLGTNWREDFSDTWKHMKNGSFDQAINNIGNSLWAQQTPIRTADFTAAIKQISTTDHGFSAKPIRPEFEAQVAGLPSKTPEKTPQADISQGPETPKTMV